MRKSSTALKAKKETEAQIVATYAGLDYHKKFTVIALGDQDGNLIGIPKRVINDKESMREFFAKHSNIECAIESCRGS
jgi:hypothetical protein